MTGANQHQEHLFSVVQYALDVHEPTGETRRAATVALRRIEEQYQAALDALRVADQAFAEVDDTPMPAKAAVMLGAAAAKVNQTLAALESNPAIIQESPPAAPVTSTQSEAFPQRRALGGGAGGAPSPASVQEDA